VKFNYTKNVLSRLKQIIFLVSYRDPSQPMCTANIVYSYSSDSQTKTKRNKNANTPTKSGKSHETEKTKHRKNAKRNSDYRVLRATQVKRLSRGGFKALRTMRPRRVANFGNAAKLYFNMYFVLL